MKKTKINWTKKDTVVVSDIHVGSKSCKIEKFHAFLEDLLDHPPKRLILNGDFFELWSTNYVKFGKYEHKSIRKILKLAEVGVKIVFIPGNHDRAFRTFGHFTLGKIKIRNEYVVKNGRKKFLVLHGDEFDLFTKNHVIISLILDQAIFFLAGVNALFKKYFGINAPLALRKKSGRYQKIVTKIKKAATLYARFRQMNGVVVGHTHWPEFWQSKKKFIYINTGDWVDNCTYAVLSSKSNLYFFEDK